MIEVEKKCLATAPFLEFLKNHANKLGESLLEDIYLDFEDLRLIKNDIWLRKRNEQNDAQEKILEFMRTHSIKNEIVNGKIIEYFRLYRQDIFELFKVNPHHAHRIVE